MPGKVLEMKGGKRGQMFQRGELLKPGGYIKKTYYEGGEKNRIVFDVYGL